jgi:hypothetical protein
MKNLKLGLLLLFFVAFTSNQAVHAQNKIENKEKIQSTSVDNEINRVKIEKRIENIEEEMKKASPEDQVQMQNKIDAYRLKNGIEDKATIKAKKEAQLQKRAQMVQGNPGVNKAGYEAMLTQKKLESSAKQIEIAKAKLNAAKIEGSLSAANVQQHELKIQAAEKELKEANIALDKKMSVLKQEHAQRKSMPNK